MNTSRSVPILGAVLATSGLLIAGCGASPQSERGSDTFGPIARVEVTADAGSVQVQGGPDGSARVDRDLRWSGDKPAVTQEVRGDVLVVTATCPDKDGCSTDLTLTVPAATSVTAQTRAGNVGGTGLGAVPVVAKTSAGNVDLTFTAAPPTVDAETTAGNVLVRLPIGPAYECDATTAAGKATIEVPDTPGADSKIRARSSAGNVSVVPG